jgi:K+/H+ antiporter YhaU regulatory subunit KhtT
MAGGTFLQAATTLMADGLTLMGIRRGGQPHMAPDPDLRLEPGDTLVMLTPPTDDKTS